MEKRKNYDVFMKRAETNGDKINIDLECSIGKYEIEIPKKHFSLFLPWQKYVGFFKVHGIPDFEGDEEKWENVCTLSMRLERILNDSGDVLYDNGKVIYEKKNFNVS